MADILLTHGYFLFEDEKEAKIMKPYPTLGLLYISAYLRRAGFAVEVFDSTFSSRAALFEKLQKGPEECTRHLYKSHNTERSPGDNRPGPQPWLGCGTGRTGSRQLSARVY